MSERRRLVSMRETVGNVVVIAILAVAARAATHEPSASTGNIAHLAKVTMSSNCGLQPKGQPGRVEPLRLVDAKRVRHYDACTKSEERPWVSFDFENSRRIAGIGVHGRGDCCWERMGFPLLAEVSSDGVHFDVVARRDVPFTRGEPWRVSFGARVVRVVRLRSEVRGEIVLSEVEIMEASPPSPPAAH